MKTLISEMFILIAALSLLVAGALFLRNSVTEGVEAVVEYLEDRKSIRQVETEAKSLKSQRLRELVIEVLVWDTRRYMEWLQTGSMLKDAEKQKQIVRCRRQLPELEAEAANMVRNMTDAEILELIKTETGKRDTRWRRDLLARIRG